MTSRRNIIAATLLVAGTWGGTLIVDNESAPRDTPGADGATVAPGTQGLQGAPGEQGDTVPVAAELIASRLATGFPDLTIGVASDSTLSGTTGGLYGWLQAIATKHPSLRIEYGLWDTTTEQMPTQLATLQAGFADAGRSTPQTLTVYNASIPGRRIAYHASQIDALFPTVPDVILFSSGHNHAADTPATFLAEMEYFAEAASAEYPGAELLVASQNPQFAPSPTIEAHDARQAALRAWARASGYGYLGVLEAFRRQPDGGASAIWPDGIHPIDGNLWSGALNELLE